MLDYYALPRDFPAFESSRLHPLAAQRVAHLEAALASEFRDPRFIPHLTLHEFEAWIFSDLSACQSIFPRDVDISPLFAARTAVTTPEDIDEGPMTAPSKRIKDCHSRYQKNLDGPLALQAIGLPKIREECPHFAAWLERLERLCF